MKWAEEEEGDEAAFPLWVIFCAILYYLLKIIKSMHNDFIFLKDKIIYKNWAIYSKLENLV